MKVKKTIFVTMKNKKWVVLPTKLWADRCCDCGLVHINELRTSEKGVEIRCWRATKKDLERISK